MLRRVFYVSEISDGTTPLAVGAIVSASMIWNRRHDVTGLLAASRRNFAQVLECRNAQMELVLHRIRSDSHHRAIHVQIDEAAALRLFPGWAMGYVQLDDLSDELADLHRSASQSTSKIEVLARLVNAGRDLLPGL